MAVKLYDLEEGFLNPTHFPAQIGLRIQVTLSPGLPSRVPVHACYPTVIISGAQFHFQKYLALYDKEYGLST